MGKGLTQVVRNCAKISAECIFTSGKLTLRQLDESDAEVLVKWLSDPAVLEYYEGRDHVYDMQMVQETFYLAEPWMTRCLIEYDGKKIGYLQFYRLNQEDLEEYSAGNCADICYAADQFIGEHDYWNRGIGTELMKGIVQYLFAKKKAHRIFLDPHCRNRRAVRCYEKCGFRKVCVLEAHELHEGRMEDCFLMECVQDDGQRNKNELQDCSL
ncbi:MAG: acetyltransferase [Lachnospiraceae bacterium]|nr:acetyltransferase [Lachnospiraceae bacterium]